MSCKLETTFGGTQYAPEKVAAALRAINKSMSLSLNVGRFAKVLTNDNSTEAVRKDVKDYLNNRVLGLVETEDVFIDDLHSKALIESGNEGKLEVLKDILNFVGYKDDKNVYLSKFATRELNALKKQVLELSKTAEGLSEYQVDAWITDGQILLSKGLQAYIHQTLAPKAEEKMKKDKKLNSVGRNSLNSLLRIKPDALETSTISKVNDAMFSYVHPNKATVDQITINTLAIEVLGDIREYNYPQSVFIGDSFGDELAGMIHETILATTESADLLSKQWAEQFNSLTLDEIGMLSPKQQNEMLLYADKALEFGAVPSKLGDLIHLAKTSYISGLKVDRDFTSAKKKDLKMLVAMFNDARKQTTTTNLLRLIDSVYTAYADGHPETKHVSKKDFYDFMYAAADPSVRRQLSQKFNSIIGDDAIAAANEYFKDEKAMNLNRFNEFMFEWFGSIDGILKLAAKGDHGALKLIKAMKFDKLTENDERAEVDNKKFTKTVTNKIIKAKVNGKSILEKEGSIKFMGLVFLKKEFADASHIVAFSSIKKSLILELNKMLDANNSTIEEFNAEIRAFKKDLEGIKTMKSFEKYIGNDAVKLYDFLNKEAQVVNKAFHNALKNSSRHVDTRKLRNLPTFFLAETDFKKRNRLALTGQQEQDNLVSYVHYNEDFDAKDYEVSESYKAKDDKVLNPNVFGPLLYHIATVRRRAYTIEDIEFTRHFIESDKYNSASKKGNSLKTLYATIDSYMTEITGGAVDLTLGSEYEKTRNSAFQQILSEVGTIGAAAALVKLKQAFAQVVPLEAHTAMLTKGLASPEVLFSIAKMGDKSPWMQMFEEQGLPPALRGAESIGGELRSTQLEHMINIAQLDAGDVDGLQSAILKGGKALRKGLHYSANKIAAKGLEVTVQRPDVSEFASGYVTFLKEWYRDNNVEWNEAEILKGNIEEDAKAWARHNINVQQAPASRSQGAKIYKNQNSISSFITRFIFPYQTFSNYNRMNELSDILVLMSDASAKDKQRAGRNLAGIVSSQIAFQLIGHLMNEFIWILAFLAMGMDEEEIESIIAKRRERAIKWSLTSLARDLTPYPGADIMTPRILNTVMKLFGVEEQIFIEKKLSEEIGTLGSIGGGIDLFKQFVMGAYNMAGYAVADNYYTGELDVYKVNPKDAWTIRYIGLWKMANLPIPWFNDILKANREGEREITKRARKASK